MKFVVAFRELPDWMFEEIFSAGAPVLICWFCCYSQACASISLSRCSHWGWSWCWRILSGIWTVFFAVRRTPIAFRVGNPFRFIKRCFNHKKPSDSKTRRPRNLLQPPQSNVSPTVPLPSKSNSMCHPNLHRSCQMQDLVSEVYLQQSKTLLEVLPKS